MLKLSKPNKFKIVTAYWYYRKNSYDLKLNLWLVKMDEMSSNLIARYRNCDYCANTGKPINKTKTFEKVTYRRTFCIGGLHFDKLYLLS